MRKYSIIILLALAIFISIVFNYKVITIVNDMLYTYYILLMYISFIFYFILASRKKSVNSLQKKILIILLVVPVVNPLYSSVSSIISSPSNNQKESSIPDGVSSSCFCMDALAGGTNYGATYKQKSMCKKMFICWNNAQADCLLGTSQVWYECIP